MPEHVDILRRTKSLKSASDISPLAGGRTNHNYLVRAADGGPSYVARFAPSSSKELGLDRRKEIHNQTIAAQAGITANVVEYDEAHDLLIVEYLEGRTLAPADAASPDVLERMGRLLAKLHSLGGFEGSFDVLEDAQSNYERVTKRGGWLPPQTSHYMNLLAERSRSMRVVDAAACHFDLMLENILIDARGNLMLIDWEYSGVGDWRFDIAMYLAKAGAGSAAEAHLLRSYGIENPDELHDDLITQKALMSLSIAMYAAAQYAFSDKDDVDYRSYAEGEMTELEKALSRTA